MKSLTAIEEANEQGRYREAVGLLLKEWSASRATVLAEAIEAVAARAPRVEPPVLRTNKAFQEHWLALAAANDPLAVSWLAETLAQRIDREGMLFNERVAELRKHPDPRYAKALVTMIEDGRRETRWASEELVDVLVTMGDERTKIALEALVALESGDWGEVLSKLRPIKPPDAATLERLGRLTGRSKAPKPKSGGGDPAVLLEAVRKAPDDLEARSVLADRLQELGDPHGELIALQLAELGGAATAETCKRADELIKKNLKTLLGPLFPLVYRGRFRGGFLEEMELEGRWKSSEKGWASITEDPRLATVRYIVEGKTTGDVLARFYRSKTMRAIDKVRISSKDVAIALRENPPPRLRCIEAFEFKRGSYDKQLEEYVVPLLETIPTVERIACALDGVGIFQRTKAFARLKELQVISWRGLKGKQAAELLAALPKSLQVLDFVTDETDDAIALVPKLPLHVTTFQLGEQSRLVRHKKGFKFRIVVRHKIELDPKRHISSFLIELLTKKKLIDAIEVCYLTDDYDRTFFAASKWKGIAIEEKRIFESGLTRPYKHA